jgi:hypothetical protein
MTPQEQDVINKYLTEAMGECYHEVLVPSYRCTCGEDVLKAACFNLPNSDFFTWAGFGKLWEFAQEQEWVYRALGADNAYCAFDTHVDMALIDPTILAVEIYNYLSENPNA